MAQAYCDGKYSPKMFQFIEHIGAFTDESQKFATYLRKVETNATATSRGLKLRTAHRVHPKVFHDPSFLPHLLKFDGPTQRPGLSLLSSQRKVDDSISKSEFYNLCMCPPSQRHVPA